MKRINYKGICGPILRVAVMSFTTLKYIVKTKF